MSIDAVPDAGKQAAISLAIEGPTGECRVVELPFKRLVVGRSEACDVVLAHDTVSKNHMEMFPAASGIAICDLGSYNGTYVNGEWAAQAIVKRGDRIRVGQFTLSVLVDGAPGAAPPAPETAAAPAAETAAPPAARAPHPPAARAPHPAPPAGARRAARTGAARYDPSARRLKALVVGLCMVVTVLIVLVVILLILLVRRGVDHGGGRTAGAPNVWAVCALEHAEQRGPFAGAPLGSRRAAHGVREGRELENAVRLCIITA